MFWRSAGSVHQAIPCLILVLVGCKASSTNEPSNADSQCGAGRSPARCSDRSTRSRLGGSYGPLCPRGLRLEHFAGSQPLPICRHLRRKRGRLRSLLRNGRRKALPDSPRIRRWHVRLRRRWPPRPLLRHVHTLTAGHGEEGPKQTVQEPWRRQVPRRDRDGWTWLRGVLSRLDRR